MNHKNLTARVMSLPVRGITSLECSYSCGNAREFYSEADYWWRNPDDPAGKYINRDGESNPDCFNRHRKVLMRLSCITGFLAQEYMQSNEKVLLDKLCEHLQIWFADENISMLPHLEYSQAIRNQVPGRSYGIIDTIHLAEVALAVLNFRSEMPEKLVAAIVKWFEQYLQWLCNSQLGITERAALNNHAVCWYLQAAAFAHLTEKHALLDEFRNDFADRLLEQIAHDGALPQELKRTKPYGYELFTLEAFAGLAALLSTPQYNAFLQRKGNGGSVFDAVDFMGEYIEDKSRWCYQKDVKYFDYWPVKQNALYLVDAFCGKKDVRMLWEKLPGYRFKFELVRNYPVRTPDLWII